MSDTLFLQVLNMSFTASFVIVFVLLARLALQKAPKIFSYALWSAVLFRLVCPVSFESVLSLLPTEPNPIPSDILYAQVPQIHTGIPLLNNSVNAILPAATPDASMNPLQFWAFLGCNLWLLGVVVLLGYSVISLWKLRRRLRDATHESGNIYTSANLTSPFVMGLFRPKIYLPASLTESEKAYILLHEQTHIKRLDHVVKLLSFFVLCLHWFNPLVWAAFFFSGRDMELSCDEAVIQSLGSDVKKDYSSSLLTLATGRRIVGGTPLAFGEGDTKSRIQNVLHYQKPAFWVIVVSVIAVVAVGVGLMANPLKSRSFSMTGENLSDLEPLEITAKIGDIVDVDLSELKLTPDNFGLTVNSNFDYVNDEVVRFLYNIKDDGAKAAQLHFRVEDQECSVGETSDWAAPKEEIYTLLHYLEALKYLPQEEIEAMSKNPPQRYAIELSTGNAGYHDGRQIYYDKNGVCEEGGWLIRLDISPMYAENGGYHGVGADTIHAFYRGEDGQGVGTAQYSISKLGKNGEVLDSTENPELAQAVLMDALMKSAAWEGIDVAAECYRIRQTFPNVPETHDYYAYRLQDEAILPLGTAVLQNGVDGRYSVLSAELYQALADSFETATLYAMRPMILVNGVLYLDTGKAISGKIDDAAVLGTVSSCLNGSKKPTENGQTNFSAMGAKYAAYGDGMVIFLENQWFFFEQEKPESTAAD